MVSSAPLFRVMKFGGTSVGGPEQMRTVIGLVTQALQDHRVCLVASAISGVTDLLLQAVRPVDASAQALCAAEQFRDVHERTVKALEADLGAEMPMLRTEMGALANECEQLLRGVTLLGECSPLVVARLSSLGERMSCAILYALLKAKGLEPLYLDPRQHIFASGDPLHANPRPEAIHEAFQRVLASQARVCVLPGFFGGNEQGSFHENFYYFSKST